MAHTQGDRNAEISQEAMREVEVACARYQRAVKASRLARSSKVSYARFVRHFLDWLQSDFDPGESLRQSPLASARSDWPTPRP